MSHARRVADALAAAHEDVKTAEHAAARYRHRSDLRGSFPQHITDLTDLSAAVETLHYLTHDLAKLVKSCADNVRTYYIHGHTPTSDPWPDNVKRRAAEVDQSLSRLRGYLDSTPADSANAGLQVLLTVIRDTHRKSKRSPDS